MLHTRLHKPNTCSDAIMRVRLFNQLSSNVNNPLTLVSAPAGFGKSTLVTSWLDHVATKVDDQASQAFRTAWLSVDVVDNDPLSFFSALVAAIESAFPGACADIQVFLQSGQPLASTWLTSAIAHTCTALPSRLVLVIDDYYLITNDAVHAAMSTLIRTWSENVHTVIATRTNPPLRLPQLRAQQRLLEIRSTDLQFDREELGGFVRAKVNDELPTLALDTLHGRTEGWAVGVRLAVTSLQERGDAATFIREFERNGNRYIMDYLVDEVLHAQPADMQSFLLRTAVLPRMCAALCAAVTEPLDELACQTMLEQLEQRNLFIVNLDDHRGWYRYHHQFQALLLNHLRLQLGEAGIWDMRLRAAEWLAANAYPDEAIAEYAAMSAFDQAAQVIEDNLVAMQNDEEWLRLSRWLSHVPQADLYQRPGLLIALGWIKRFQNADEEIAELATRAERLLAAADDTQQSRWTAQLSSLKTSGEVIPDIEERIAVAGQARRLAAREQIWVRTYAAINEITKNQQIGYVDRALNLLGELIDDPDFNNGKGLARLHLAAVAAHAHEGTLSGTIWHAQRCRDYSTQHHMPMTAAWGSCLMGLTRFQQNELAEAEGHFQAVLDARFAANWQAAAYAAQSLLTMLAERGDLAKAHALVGAVRELERAKSNQVDMRVSEALAAYLALHRSDQEAALEWARSSAADKPKNIRLDDPELPILVHILIAQNTPASLARAQSALAALIERCQRINNRRVHHQALVWLACVKQAQGRYVEALDALAEAVAFGQPRGFLRWFVEGGEPVREMLGELVRNNRHAAEVTSLLAQMARSQGQPSVDSEGVLSQTKLYKPRAVDTWIARPRLAQALDEGLSRKLILVDAPAGYGKTTLLAQWLSAQPLAAAWLSLDEADNDLSVFLSYLAQAVRMVHSDSMHMTAMLLSAMQLPPVDDLAGTLINELDALPDEIVLVLDDFHVIQSPEIAQLVSRLADRPPSSLHLVLTTRSDPNLPLAKLRARGEILEIRAADLRFSPDEARAFLQNEVPHPLNAAAAQMLEDRTEGWPAGMRLAALSLKSSSDPQSFIDAFSSGNSAHVASFLVNEVLSNLEAPLQDFLLRASLLDRFCAPLCDALRDPGQDNSDAADSNALLNEIGRRNLFLIPLDNSGDWFRFHHLFRDLLRKQLQARMSERAVAGLHGRASDWLAEQGLHEEALQHADAAGDTEQVLRLVESNVHGILNREEWVTLTRWLAFVPPEVVQRRPRLLLAQAYVKVMRNELADVPALVDEAERLINASDSDRSSNAIDAATGEILTLRAAVTLASGMGLQGAEQSEQALRLLPESYHYPRGLSLMSLAMNLQVAGQTAEAEARLRQEEAQATSTNSFTVRIPHTQCVVSRLAGALVSTGDLTERYIAVAETAGLMVSTCWAYAYAGWRRHEMDEVERAIEHFEVVLQYAHQASVQCRVTAYMQLALSQQAAGRPEMADAALRDLRAHAQAAKAFFNWKLIDAMEARLQLLRGDVASALRWVQSSSAQTNPTTLIMPDLPNLTRAQILIAHRSTEAMDEAMALLQHLLEVTKACNYHGPRAKVMAAQASALWVLNRHDAALHVLSEAVDIGQRGMLIRTFADLGADVLPVMRALAGRTVKNSLRHDYLTRVIAAFGVAPTIDVTPIEAASLTLRECEVLDLLDRHRSDKEIAEALVLSRLTVSKHTANIYRKLGVGNRREAVIKARALGLLVQDT